MTPDPLVKYAENELGAKATELPTRRYEEVYGLAVQALPEKYIDEYTQDFNQAFGFHLGHYAETGNPPASGGALKRFIQKWLDSFSEKEYKSLCAEMEGLIELRNHEDEKVTLDAISSQTGTNHRSLIAGLKALKPHMVADACFQLHPQDAKVPI